MRFTNKEECHPKRIVWCYADALINVEGIKDPILPEILVLEVNHSGESLREVIEDCTTDDLLLRIQNRDTEITPLEEVEKIRVIVEQVVCFPLMWSYNLHDLIDIIKVTLSD